VKSTVEVGLFYSESVKDFCCGLIQGGSTNRACCKAVDKCTTQSHKDNKAIIRNGCFHIRGIKANQLLIEPSLDGYRLSKVKLNDLINEKRQSNVWIKKNLRSLLFRMLPLVGDDGVGGRRELGETGGGPEADDVV
jgi:hypothetical protein